MVGPNDKRNDRLIEEAVIKDILKKDDIDRFPLTTRDAYYGPDYVYYQDTYEKASGVDIYQAEFVFQEEENGIILFLYVYKDKPYNIDNVMQTLRFVETDSAPQG